MSESPSLVRPGDDAAPGDHMRTILALVLVLEALVAKVKEIRTVDGRSRHAMAAGHLRSALTYEQEVLDDLMDPRGMMAMTHKALFEQWKTASIQSAMKQLTGGSVNG